MDLFEKPSLSNAERILAIQPHYDDNDIAAGGTLTTFSGNDAELLYLPVTDDLVGVIDITLTDEEAAERLKSEQILAGEIISVNDQIWLGYPDAGKYDYFDLRSNIIECIRRIRPNFIFTCDPWMPYEAHQDHFQTGRAADEAAILYS
jgi:LmbE family N-acetylglucosaminyl deacetylase